MTNDTFHQSNDELDQKNEKYRNEVLEQLKKNKLKIKITYNIEDLMKYLRQVIKLKSDKPFI
jgi:energy-coupling factor transporter ATP-binding protein EcfA2